MMSFRAAASVPSSFNPPSTEPSNPESSNCTMIQPSCRLDRDSGVVKTRPPSPIKSATSYDRFVSRAYGSFVDPP